MKNLLFLSYCCLFLFGCSTSSSLTGETTYAGPSEKGTLLVNAQGYGSSKNTALENASRNAFKNLLFKGIPGSYQYLPLLGEKALQVQAQKEAFFKDFFVSKTYEQFILNKEVGKFRSSGKGQANLLAKLHINASALRSYLEQKQVIRKFGL